MTTRLTGTTGSFALILHAHLPFVRHPEHEDFLEEDWLFEAITETYLPLLRMMRRLADDGVAFKLTMSLTPTLCAMLRDELLQQRYLRHLERLIALAQQEIERNRHHAQLFKLARFYREFLCHTRDFFQELNGDLVRAFCELQDAGFLEIIASAATHAFLPLLQDFPAALRAQILIGCDNYREMFSRDPVGFWLPECGYSTQLDAILQEANIRWFVIDSHGLMFARPRPRYALFAPCYTPAGPAAFARDGESTRDVWSAESGYPGHPAYRDFYRDAGFDRPEDELRPFVRPMGFRKFTGLKYHRITGATSEKDFYDRSSAEATADEDAEHFFAKCRVRFAELNRMNLDPIIVSPFDAELFGHWWFEGPRFLESFIRQTGKGQESFSLTTPGDFLASHPTQQVVRPNPSSWGEGGFSAVWLDERSAWIYPHLHAAAERMIEIARANRETNNPLIERALKQSARELLLAQASDWAFLMKTHTAPEYAAQRTKDHLLRFNRLYEQIRDRQIDSVFLAECEERNNIFPNLDWRYYV